MTDAVKSQPDHIEQFFKYDHLPEKLQVVSKPFGDLAQRMVETLPRNPERTVMLRKLLEAKDAAVRALVAVSTLLVLLVGASAFADPVIIGAPPPTGVSGILAGLLSPQGIGAAVAVVLGAVGGFQFFSAKRKRILALATYHAFHIVEDVTNEMDDGPVKDGFNKAEAGLKAVDDYLVKNGWRPLKEGEAPAAALALQAIHGGEVAKAKLAVAQPEGTVAAQAAQPEVPKPA